MRHTTSAITSTAIIANNTKHETELKLATSCWEYRSPRFSDPFVLKTEEECEDCVEVMNPAIAYVAVAEMEDVGQHGKLS